MASMRRVLSGSILFMEEREGGVRGDVEHNFAWQEGGHVRVHVLREYTSI